MQILEMSERFFCARDPEHVFDYITDFSRIDEWDQTVTRAEKTSEGLIALGSRFNVLYSMGLRKVPIDYQITEFEPHSHAVLRGRSATFTATDTVKVEQAEGGCYVNWHAHIEFSGIAAKILPLIKGRVTKAGTQTIRGLATALADDYPAPTLSFTKRIGDKLVLPGLAGFTKYGYQHAKRNWNPISNSVKGLHMLITGATSGLGLATAQALAHRGAHLTLVARNASKAEQVAQDIRRQTGNAQIRIEIADLAEIEQVVALSERLLEAKRPIDVLINNAGALLNSRTENNNGLETSFALLLLGPVILTENLKPLLRRPASDDSPSRVINVLSGGLYAKRVSVNNLESNRGEYSGTEAYARAKRGLLIATEQWAKQWAGDGIIVHSMHPGWAQTPGVEQSLPGFNQKMQKVLRSPAQGADTIIWLACATEVAKTNGLFWLDREPHTTHLSRKTQETTKQRESLFSALKEYAMRYDTNLELGC